MEPERWRTQARSFGSAAALYDRIRPSYPAAVIEWVLQPLGRVRHRVLDVGAGTGILTRQLVDAAHTVLAVEPDDQMRQILETRTPQALALAGSAEAIPLPDASVDGAVAGQAYHWFDRDRAHAELARVIRPGGVFAAIWNDRDESRAWVAEYSRIVDGDRGLDGGAESDQEAIEFGENFSTPQFARFRHEARYTPETLVELLRSRSYFLTATPKRRAALEAEVRDLATSHPDLAGRAEFALPYVTVAHRATRLHRREQTADGCGIR
jgi:ubiquinone/menaquinone biosynthesis C-methylase UbiE